MVAYVSQSYPSSLSLTLYLSVCRYVCLSLVTRTRAQVARPFFRFQLPWSEVDEYRNYSQAFGTDNWGRKPPTKNKKTITTTTNKNNKETPLKKKKKVWCQRHQRIENTGTDATGPPLYPRETQTPIYEQRVLQLIWRLTDVNVRQGTQHQTSVSSQISVLVSLGVSVCVFHDNRLQCFVTFITDSAMCVWRQLSIN